MKSRLYSTLIDIHISCNLWTSPNYLLILGVISHYISKDGQLKSAILALVDIKGEHSGENLARYLQEVVEDQGISNKLGYIQMDNTTNNNTIMREFEDRKYSNTLLPSYFTNFIQGHMTPGISIIMQSTIGSDVQAILLTYQHSPSYLLTKPKPLRLLRIKQTSGGGQDPLASFITLLLILDVQYSKKSNRELFQGAEILLEIIAHGGTPGIRCLVRLFPYKRLQIGSLSNTLRRSQIWIDYCLKIRPF